MSLDQESRTQHLEQLRNTMEKFKIKNKWQYENGFYLTSDRQRYMKSYMHNELFNLSMKSKGDILSLEYLKTL